MTEIMLTPQNIALFAHMIPFPFRQGLEEGSLVGVGGMDEYYDNEPVAVLLCRVEHGWMEIVWLCTDSDFRGMGYGSQLLHARLDAAKQGGLLWGAFLDLPEDGDEARLPMERMLSYQGFRMQEVSYPVYSATLAECARIGILRRSSFFGNVIPLGKAEPYLLHDVSAEIRKDNRPVPLPRHARWEDYDPQLSGIYMRGNKPTSLLLVGRAPDTLIIRCAWAKDPAGIAVLLSYALQTAEKICPAETIVEVPTVSGASETLVKKIFPHTEQLKMTQARLPFTMNETEVIF